MESSRRWLHCFIFLFASVLGGVDTTGYLNDISVSALSAHKRPVCGMTNNSVTTGVPNVNNGYGVFAYLPAKYNNKYEFSITLFAEYDYYLNFVGLYVRSSWEGAETWKQVTLT